MICSAGNLDFISHLSIGRDLTIKETVTNIGNETSPNYLIHTTVTNNGNSDLYCQSAFSSFLATSEGAKEAAAERNINPVIVSMDPQGMTGKTIGPGELTGYDFESGANTTALVNLNGGRLQQDFMIFQMTDDEGKVDVIAYVSADLPTVIGIEGKEIELKPGETRELELYRA